MDSGTHMAMNLFFAGLNALVFTFIAIPSIIRVAQIKNLYDDPDTVRKTHISSVPTLGGFALFAGTIFSLTFWSNQNNFPELQYIIASILIVFFIGIKDDIVQLVHWKKLAGQVLAAIILVHFAQIRLTTMCGIFGIYELPTAASYLFSIFTIIVITNSFNLIDGIDCLAGSIGALTSFVFGMWFHFYGKSEYAILAFSLLGSLIAFLWFNKTPAKIFMGDTGSLIIGLANSIFAIKFIELNWALSDTSSYKIFSIPVVTICILIVPLFDTFRVFVIRLSRKQSPLKADRNHIHHILVDSGISHIAATSILFSINLLFIIFALMFQHISSELLFFITLSLAVILSVILVRYNKATC